MRKLLLLPTKKQWVAWSLPSKLTLLSFWVGIVGLLFAIFSSSSFLNLVGADQSKPKRYYSLSAMREEIGGFNKAYLSLKSEIDYFLVTEFKSKYEHTPEDDWRYKYEIKLLNSNLGGLDLNNDGIPELVVELPLYCGSGGCSFDIYSFDEQSNHLKSIGNLPVSNYQLTGSTIDGWVTIEGKWRMGACETIESVYSFQDGQYVEEQSKTVKHC